MSIAGGAAAGAGSVDLFEGSLELGTRVGEVLEELGLTGELDDEGLILGRGEHLVEEGAAGGALFVDDAALAAAGVDEEAEGKGKVLVEVEVADGLRVAVDLEDEVILGEVLDEGSLFIANDDGEVHQAGIDGEWWGRLALEMKWEFAGQGLVAWTIEAGR